MKFIFKMVAGTVIAFVTIIVVAVVVIGAGSAASTSSTSDNTGADAETKATRAAEVSNTTKSRRIDRQSASGDFAIAQASGNVSEPRKIRVRVSASPSQKVEVAWNVVCAKDFGSGSKDGQFKGHAPLTKALRLPMRNPDDCTVAANAQLSHSGKVTVTLLG